MKNEIKACILIGINLKLIHLEKGTENHKITAYFLCNSLNLNDIDMYRVITFYVNYLISVSCDIDCKEVPF